ncbi:hypothetical protein BDZ88DRAFT_415724 [Geranomyces variabilis]|nr:hypothetical protein BDZ88DRAFT_415724 [Geranomyces variabilis]
MTPDMETYSGNSSSNSTAGDAGDELYCICRQTSHGDMVACDNPTCAIEWFHYACVGLIHPPKGKWYCSACLDAGYRLAVSGLVADTDAAKPTSTPKPTTSRRTTTGQRKNLYPDFSFLESEDEDDDDGKDNGEDLIVDIEEIENDIKPKTVKLARGSASTRRKK